MREGINSSFLSFLRGFPFPFPGPRKSNSNFFFSPRIFLYFPLSEESNDALPLFFFPRPLERHSSIFSTTEREHKSSSQLPVLSIHSFFTR